ncbi:hypothetical protein RE628_17620 [Paenibacillus sp. D2_2]|uniref:hypothetical protein n=1 Tax=Paenibacillus sp. D2_2 TaxID=3073092 RepID=UPI0028165865|nr:hypothetical protein [Paenibacillus sp. D2_2]WMT39271.1 hypothetical protein RE628_17620 [Paenibacillus sp. D2_2]
MAVYNGSIKGTAANGSLSTKSKRVTIYSIGYDVDTIPISIDGREMTPYELGSLTTYADLVDIYRWGTWRVMDSHNNLIGWVSDKYQYGIRTKIGQPFELNTVLKHKWVGSVSGTGLIRDGLRGLRIKENFAGNTSVIKVFVLEHQGDLIGKTWGDWTDNGSGGSTTTHLRPRKYPDTHLPRRREDT